MQRTHFKLTAVIAAITLASCASEPVKPPPAPVPAPLAGMPILASNGSETAAPATQPAPSGESDIAAIIKQRKQPKAVMNGELPAGHPPISGGGKTPAMPSDMQLPAGHPDMAQMQAMLAERNKKPASTQPAMYGTLTVRAVQATAGGAAVGELPVTVELVQGQTVIDKYEAKLDAAATATFNNVPVSLQVTPVVRVNYGGVEYSATGNEMNSMDADEDVQVAVYETTEQEPAWTVQMQHVMLEPTTSGVRVMEMLAVTNPSDRAWIGKLAADNKRLTQTFTLPPGATDVQLSGAFHDCCTKIEDGKISNTMALVPGTTQYRMLYTLPVSAGKAQIALKTAAPVGHFMLFCPDDGTKIVAEGIEDGGVANMGGGKTRYFKAMNLAGGKEIKLSLSGITATEAAASGSSAKPQAAKSGQTAKIVAGAGGLLIFVVGGMFLLRKAPSSSKH